MIFSWTAGNLDHIAKHGVTRDESESVVRGTKPPWPEIGIDSRRRVWGKTPAGRLLQVVFIFPSDDEVDASSLSLTDLIAWSDGDERVASVIHARDLEDDEKHQYRKRSRRS